MSWMNARNLAMGGAAVGAVAFFFPRTTSQVVPNAFETQAVKNVANRHSAGGGSTTHTPGAATPRGSAEKTGPNVMQPKGAGTAHFQETHNDQKIGEPDRISAAFHKAHYGESNTKGK